MRCLGIDTAHRNLGLGVVEVSGSARAVLLKETFTPPTDRAGLFYNNAHCVRRLRGLLQELRPFCAVMEAAAVSRHFNMTAKGAVHGALLQVLVDARIPFIYAPPQKVKLFMTGSGRAEKAGVKGEVLRVLGKQKPALDSNRADALAMALMGEWFARALLHGVEEAMAHLPGVMSGIRRECVWDVFLSEEVNESGLPAGILRRPDEFFWIPIERREELHVSVR